MKKAKRILASALSAIMLISALPATAVNADGIAYYGIDTVYNNNRVTGYDLNILGKSVYVETPAYEVGDVDQDGIVTINDATAIQLYLIDKQELDFTQEYAADTNNDGSITVEDVTEIQFYLAKMIDSFD